MNKLNTNINWYNNKILKVMIYNFYSLSVNNLFPLKNLNTMCYKIKNVSIENININTENLK